MESSSFSGSSKRAKAPSSTAQVAHCLVDGCNADLSLCRDYHRRHKVCELHSKTPKVTIGGREQRFCQQCSRFHSLVEFDEGKRSCRKRLDGHNRRRRKSQPDSLARTSTPDFSHHQGTRLLSFSTPQILPSAVVGFSWPKTEPEIGPLCSNYHHHHQPNYIEPPSPFPLCSPHSSFRGLNELEVIQEDSISQSAFLDPSQVIDCDGALSLLSSASPAIRAEQLPHGPGLVDGLKHGGLANQYYRLDHECEPSVSSVDSHGGEASILHFPDMFQHGAEGSSTSGSHQTLTFMWDV